jgi:hypothetical protein
MKKRIQIFIFLCFWVYPSFSKDSGVMVRSMVQEIFETTPGTNIMATFRVTNQTPEDLEFIPETILPKGWKPITRDLPFEIAAVSSDLRLVSFHVPRETPAGRYEISFSVASRKRLAVSDFYSITVLVLPVRRLRIRLLDAPAFVIAGESYTIPFQVINESNVAGTIRLEYNDTPAYIIQPDTSRFRLESGESRLTGIRVRTDAAIESMLTHYVTILARFAGDSAAADEGHSAVKIVPAGLVKTDRYNRIPVTLGVTYAAQKNGTLGQGWQFEVSGSGPLSRNNSDLVSFYFRGPDTYLENLYTYGLHEQYSMSYRNEKFQVDLGDKSYTLSKLTEQFRWGRGAEAQIRSKGWNAGAFAHRTLYFWSGSVRREAAAYLRRSFGGQNAVGLNYLHKMTPDDDADLFSAQGNFRLNRLAELELEVAASPGDGKIRQACDASLTGRWKNFFYSGYWIYASPRYPGYYTNTRIQALGLSYRFLKNLRVDCNVNRQKQQYDVETHRVVAPVLSYSSVGLAYEWTQNTRFSLARTAQSSKDRFYQPLYNYSETAYRFDVDQSFRSLTLSGTVETGKTDNRLLGRNAGMVRVTGTAQFAPSVRNAFSGTLSYDDDRRYSDQRYKRWTLGLDLRSEVVKNTEINLSCQNQFSPESYFEDRNLFEFSVLHRAGAAHEFAVRCRKVLMHNSLDREEIAVKAEYRLTLGVPVGMNRSIGSVKGTLLDMENGKPVKRAAVRLNEYMAITDDAGRFSFQALPPGSDYYLSLDKSTIGMDKVLAQPTPLRVNVTGGGEKTLDLGVERGVAVKGKVVVYAVVNDSSDHFKAEKMKQYLNEYYVAGSSQKKSSGIDVTVTNGKTRMVPDYGLGSVLVELKKDDETYRRVTDNDGSFYFDGLRSGRWSLTVYEYNLPEMHRLEKPVSEIELKPGDERIVLVKVLPIRRQIQFERREGAVLEEQSR